MEQFIIKGKRRLFGEITVGGSKNAALPIIAAAACADGPCIIDNLPDIEDINSLCDALTKLGVECVRINEETLSIDASGLNSHTANFESVRKIRASTYLMGLLLNRFKKAEVALPGGCNFGSRPIDLHIKGFEALGSAVKIEHGCVKISADQLIGNHIYLDIASVGATINIMLAAACAQGVTTIENAAKEPHIVDTANFLNILGADIKGAGTEIIKIKGVSSLKRGNYTIIPDQIETGTYMIAAAITGGDVTIRNCIPKHMEAVTAKLREMGCSVEEGDDYLRVVSKGELNAVNIKTQFYPGFPTDLQPQMCALLCTAKGRSLITESVIDQRFQYINELKRLGAEISIEGRTAGVMGVGNLTGAEVTAYDLRAGACLITAALAAEGCTRISDIKYIDRGYDQIEKKLASIGADIERIKKF